MPLFYHYDKNLKITFIANGIGDTDKDYVLKTDIVNSVVSFSGINISRQSKELLDIKNYGIQYWMDNSKNVRKLSNRIKNILLNKYFISGFFIGLIMVSFFISIMIYKK